MTEYAMIVPPEPPIGHRVRDRDGVTWERDEDGWTPISVDYPPTDWSWLVRDGGPLKDAS